MIEIKGIDHVVWWVADMARSKHFYSDILSLKIETENDAQTEVFYKLGPTHRLGLALRQDGKGIGYENETHHLGFTSPEGETRDEIVAKLRSNGIAVWARPGDTEGIYFNDPDGHDLQIHIKGHIYGTAESQAEARRVAAQRS